MNVIIFGGSGFVGQHTAKVLVEQGYNVLIATRQAQTSMKYGQALVYEHKQLDDLFRAQTTPYAIVNLAGESINSGRWTDSRRQDILDSRVHLTRLIATAIENAAAPPVAFISASAVGYYGYSLTSEFTEASPSGQGFLAEVTRRWEAEAIKARSLTRVVLMRLGMVLGHEAGALPRMRLPYRFFLGGPIGSGKQWISWIHVEDVAHAILACLEDTQYQGAINFVSPFPVIMQQFGTTLGEVMHRPHWLPVPALAVQVALGQMSEIVLEGQKVIPLRLQQAGYSFRYPGLSEALFSLLHSPE